MARILKFIVGLIIFSMLLVRPVRDVWQWLWSCVCAMKHSVQEAAPAFFGYIVYIFKYFFLSRLKVGTTWCG